MTKQTYLNRVQWGALVAKAWADPGFRDQLEKDPTGAIRAHAEQLGVGLEKIFHLPPAPGDLTAEALGSADGAATSLATATGSGTAPPSLATATGSGTAPSSLATATGLAPRQSSLWPPPQDPALAPSSPSPLRHRLEHRAVVTRHRHGIGHRAVVTRHRQWAPAPRRRRSPPPRAPGTAAAQSSLATATGSGTAPSSLATATGSGTAPSSLATATGSGTAPSSLATATGSGTAPSSLATATGSGTAPSSATATGLAPRRRHSPPPRAPAPRAVVTRHRHGLGDRGWPAGLILARPDPRSGDPSASKSSTRRESTCLVSSKTTCSASNT